MSSKRLFLPYSTAATASLPPSLPPLPPFLHFPNFIRRRQMSVPLSYSFRRRRRSPPLPRHFGSRNRFGGLSDTHGRKARVRSRSREERGEGRTPQRWRNNRRIGETKGRERESEWPPSSSSLPPSLWYLERKGKKRGEVHPSHCKWPRAKHVAASHSLRTDEATLGLLASFDVFRPLKGLRERERESGA